MKNLNYALLKHCARREFNGFNRNQRRAHFWSYDFPAIKYRHAIESLFPLLSGRRLSPLIEFIQSLTIVQIIPINFYLFFFSFFFFPFHPTWSKLDLDLDLGIALVVKHFPGKTISFEWNSIATRMKYPRPSRRITTALHGELNVLLHRLG